MQAQRTGINGDLLAGNENPGITNQKIDFEALLNIPTPLYPARHNGKKECTIRIF